MRIVSFVPLCLFALVASLAAVEPTPDPDRIREHAEILVGFGDRRAGSDGAARAADYISERLADYGIAEVHRQQTTITGPRIDELSLTIGGVAYPIWPHRSNGVRMPSTPAGGLSGELIFVEGSVGLSAEEVRDRIVAVPADSGLLWMRIASLGAAAIIFNGSQDIDGYQLDRQHLDASLDIPRFVADLSPELEGQSATLIADIEPAMQPAISLVAHIAGTAGGEAPEMVVLSTGYDTAGTIPGLDVGTTPAWNAGALLEVARQLKQDPPRRDVLIVFEAGRVEAFRGLRQLLGILRDPRDRTVNDDEVQWPDAPLADAEVARLAYRQWRAELIANDFRTFLDEYGADGTEEQLVELLREVDYLPEERDFFEGIGYPPSVASDTGAPTEGGAEVEAVDPNAAYPFKVGLAILLTAIVALMIVGSAKKGRPHPVLTGLAVILIIFVDRSLLVRHEVSTETDVEAESERIYELGLQLISEEAARRADQLQPILEDLRSVRSFGKISDPDPRITYRIRVLNDRLEVLTGKRFGTDELDEAIESYQARHRAWRDIQQKLGNEKLKAEERVKLPELVRAVVESETGLSNLQRQRVILDTRKEDLLSSIRIRRALGIGRQSGPDPRLAIALDFSDGNSAFSSTTHGEMITWQNKLSTLNVQFRRLAHQISDERLDQAIAFDPSPYLGGNNPVAWWPEGYLHQAAFANLFLNAVTLSTVNDERPRVGTPADIPERFDHDRFLRQTHGLTALLHGMMESSVAGESRQSVALKTHSVLVETLSEGSATGTKGFPYPFSSMRFLDTPKRIYAGVTPMETAWGDAFGRYRAMWLPSKLNKFNGSFPLRIYGFGDRGVIENVIATEGSRKTKGGSRPEFSVNKLKDLKVQVFPCQASGLYDIFDPRLLTDLARIRVLSSTRDALPRQVHVEADHNAAAIFAPPGTPLRVLASVGQMDSRLVLLGDHIEDDRFLGLVPGGVLATEGEEDDPTQRRAVPTSMAVARDELEISKFRLDRLQKNGISPESIWSLLAEGQRHLESAEEAFAAGQTATARGASQSAWSYLSRVYPAVKAAANDVVYGLVVMLLLAIPFAVVCERLFISANTIMGKVGGFSAFFVATFLFFFFFHPAFALATTPVIIFLAFVIIVMSLLVIFILYNRFEYEMEQIRMTELGSHKADVSRLGTLFATGQLGISNMRRRPLRTSLTAITVVLMTFILLTFASFSDEVGTRRIDEPTPPAYNGVLVRMPSYSEMPDRATERIALSWGHRAEVFERRWLMGSGERLRFPFNGPGGPAFVEGVIGVREGDPSGIESALRRPDGGTGFAGETDWIFLSSGVRAKAGLEIGDSMTFQGYALRVGDLDVEAMAGTTHIDGQPFTPLMVSAMSEEQLEELKRQAQESEAGTDVSSESASMSHLPPGSVAVMHLGTAERIGAGVRSVALAPWADDVTGVADNGKPKQPGSRLEIERLAENVAQELGVTLRVGEGSDNYLLTAVGKLSVAGLTDVIIPLILGGLIIFSTMLGSVAERGKEIFIYASLGLAPIHIAGLFLVEAAIYATIGGLSGYMLAQMLVELLGVAADFGWGVQPDLNYSSFTAVITILLVMATVLLSSLYPAFIASRSAKPGEDTEFKVPAPDGDRMEIPFPFTVARRDIYGLLAFLRAYFDANTEASTGCFTAADAKLSTAGETFEVTAKNWLAPFDLGISQHFQMRAQQTDVKAIYRIHISLELLSGQRSAWQRVLKPFLKDLRKQFLVWRTLDARTMDRYRAEGGDDEARKRLEAEAESPKEPDPADRKAAGDEEDAGESAAERGSE